MSSNYTGNPTGVQSPSSAPGLGVDPVGVIPADGDALSAASVTQMTKVNLDFNAFMTNGRYPARSTDAPGFIYQDKAGNNRYLIDHNGYPMGQVSVFQENWNTQSGTISSSGNFQASNPWTAVIQGGAGSRLIPGLVGGIGSFGITAEAAATADSNTLSSPYMIDFQSFQSIVMEFEAYLSVIGTSNCTSIFGLGDTFVLNSVTITKDDGDGPTWQVVTTNGAGAFTTTDTGITPSAGVIDKFRIELHGSAGPYGGAVARVFINNALTTVSLTLPATGGLMRPFFVHTKTSGSSSVSRVIGPVRVVWNRALSSGAL